MSTDETTGLGRALYQNLSPINTKACFRRPGLNIVISGHVHVRRCLAFEFSPSCLGLVKASWFAALLRVVTASGRTTGVVPSSRHPSKHAPRIWASPARSAVPRAGLARLLSTPTATYGDEHYAMERIDVSRDLVKETSSQLSSVTIVGVY